MSEMERIEVSVAEHEGHGASRTLGGLLLVGLSVIGGRWQRMGPAVREGERG